MHKVLERPEIRRGCLGKPLPSSGKGGGVGQATPQGFVRAVIPCLPTLRNRRKLLLVSQLLSTPAGLTVQSACMVQVHRLEKPVAVRPMILLPSRHQAWIDETCFHACGIGNHHNLPQLLDINKQL